MGIYTLLRVPLLSRLKDAIYLPQTLAPPPPPPTCPPPPPHHSSLLLEHLRLTSLFSKAVSCRKSNKTCSHKFALHGWTDQSAQKVGNRTVFNTAHPNSEQHLGKTVFFQGHEQKGWGWGIGGFYISVHQMGQFSSINRLRVIISFWPAADATEGLGHKISSSNSALRHPGMRYKLSLINWRHRNLLSSADRTEAFRHQLKLQRLSAINWRKACFSLTSDVTKLSVTNWPHRTFCHQLM